MVGTKRQCAACGDPVYGGAKMCTACWGYALAALGGEPPDPVKEIKCSPDSRIIWIKGDDWEQDGDEMKHLPTGNVFEIRLENKLAPSMLFSYVALVVPFGDLKEEELLELGRAAIALALENKKRYPTPVMWCRFPCPHGPN